MKKQNIVRVALLFFLVAGNVSILAQGQRDPTILDEDTVVLSFRQLRYPAIARTARIQGVVVIRVSLDDGGKVMGARAVSGAEPLVADCLTNAKEWRFRPNSERAAVVVYNFRLTDAISKSGCDHFMLEPPNFVTITTCPVMLK